MNTWVLIAPTCILCTEGLVQIGLKPIESDGQSHSTYNSGNSSIKRTWLSEEKMVLWMIPYITSHTYAREAPPEMTQITAVLDSLMKM